MECQRVICTLGMYTIQPVRDVQHGRKTFHIPHCQRVRDLLTVCGISHGSHNLSARFFRNATPPLLVDVVPWCAVDDCRELLGTHVAGCIYTEHCDANAIQLAQVLEEDVLHDLLSSIPVWKPFEVAQTAVSRRAAVRAFPRDFVDAAVAERVVGGVVEKLRALPSLVAGDSPVAELRIRPSFAGHDLRGALSESFTARSRDVIQNDVDDDLNTSGPAGGHHVSEVLRVSRSGVQAEADWLVLGPPSLPKNVLGHWGDLHTFNAVGPQEGHTLAGDIHKVPLPELNKDRRSDLCSSSATSWLLVFAESAEDFFGARRSSRGLKQQGSRAASPHLAAAYLKNKSVATQAAHALEARQLSGRFLLELVQPELVALERLQQATATCAIDHWRQVAATDRNKAAGLWSHSTPLQRGLADCQLSTRITKIERNPPNVLGKIWSQVEIEAAGTQRGFRRKSQLTSHAAAGNREVESAVPVHAELNFANLARPGLQAQPVGGSFVAILPQTHSLDELHVPGGRIGVFLGRHQDPPP
mmetsp:Transcript_6374/g.11945  ORF Transcript_6374/g.11945 Transcript_6374/m.11945 type:complete len:529 (+) Transcript_6374:878-2464(+)